MDARYQKNLYQSRFPAAGSAVKFSYPLKKVILKKDLHGFCTAQYALMRP
jgi:hypothetical protein